MYIQTLFCQLACTPQAVQSFMEDEVSRFSTLQGEITRELDHSGLDKITRELDHSGLDNVSEQECRTYARPHIFIRPFAALERIILSASTLAVLPDRSRAEDLP